MVNIPQLLQTCIDRNASDIHFTVNKPPTLRIDGVLSCLDYDSLTKGDTEYLVKSIAPDRVQNEINERGGADFMFAFKDVARFRVSVYRQKGYLGLVLRLIPSKIISFEDIGLPDMVKDILNKPRGLILITGPTGAGKTTTLAAMVDYINNTKNSHIITIEDPIEYYHEHKRGIITQREIGIDVPSFSEAVIKSLRQNPDVILVGEMRDLITIEAALLAAETGHLVLSTLHTINAANTVDRIIDVFPTHQQEQIRIQLANSLLAVFSQQLLLNVKKYGRVAVFEIMLATPSIQSLIREKKTFRIISDMQTGGKYGMKTFDMSLFELCQKGLITQETAVSNAFDPAQLQAKIRDFS